MSQDPNLELDDSPEVDEQRINDRALAAGLNALEDEEQDTSVTHITYSKEYFKLLNLNDTRERATKRNHAAVRLELKHHFAASDAEQAERQAVELHGYFREFREDLIPFVEDDASGVTLRLCMDVDDPTVDNCRPC